MTNYRINVSLAQEVGVSMRSARGTVSQTFTQFDESVEDGGSGGQRRRIASRVRLLALNYRGSARYSFLSFPPPTFNSAAIESNKEARLTC